MTGIPHTSGLVVIGGMPAVGKTTIARALAQRIGATHLRIDSIEAALVGGGMGMAEMDDRGYRVGYALAGDQLDLGGRVVADSVNPIDVTRAAWRDVARSRGLPVVEVEVCCPDLVEHERRVRERLGDIPGLDVPAWEDVARREYHAWSPDVRIDTTMYDVATAVDLVVTAASWLVREDARNG
jgi:predicted kinase